jgi:hypothetical protein
MSRCRVCGAQLEDASHGLCGGDICLRVVMQGDPRDRGWER